MTVSDRVSKIAGQLEQDILEGRLAPGQMLPSERALSSQLGVSRSVIREALGRLVSLGLVQSTQGSGTRVAPPGNKPITIAYQRLLSASNHNLFHLCEIRLPLETAIVAAAAKRRSQDHLSRLERTQEQLRDNGRTLEEYVQADLDFHSILADATGNPLFKVVLIPIQQLLMESRYRTLGNYGVEIAVQHHADILKAVRDQNVGNAIVAMTNHLQTNLLHLDSLKEKGDDPLCVDPGPTGQTS